MPQTFKEILAEASVQIALPFVKVVGKAELSILLDSIKAHNSPDFYTHVLQSLYSNFTLLHEAALKTKTKIDDGLVDFVIETVREKAGADGINLTVTTIPE